MGKGSGICMREGIELDNSIKPFEDDNPPTSQQSIPAELDYSLSTIIKSWVKFKWVSTDLKVYYYRDKEGWYARPWGADVSKAMQDIGLIYDGLGGGESDSTVHFPTLKEACQAVEECAKEADINLNNRLTRKGRTEYQVGSLPLLITEVPLSGWNIKSYSPSTIGKLPASLEPFFPGGVEEFNRKCREAKLVGVDGKRWATRTQALQAVKAFRPF
jgi:hypothetical protein